MNYEGKSLFIGCPTYTSRVVVEWADALLETCDLLRDLGVPTPLRGYVKGCSILHRARRLIVAKFMASGASHLLMIDSDMIWPARAVADLLGRDTQFCGVAGLRRNDAGRTWCVRALDDGKVHYSDHTGLVRVDGIGTGFLMVRRDVFECMFRAYPQLKVNEEPVAAGEGRHNYSLFLPMVRNGIEEQDDYAFCARWRALGGEIFADPHHELVHVGEQAMRGRMYEDMAPLVAPQRELMEAAE